MSDSSVTWRRLRMTLPLLLDLLVVILLFGLDARDLYYKIAWIGPRNSFAFSPVSQRLIEAKPLVLSTNSSISGTVGSPTRHASGWPALHAKCERLHAASSSKLFIGAMGFNCDVGVARNTTAISHLYMSASVRADSMAWAACKLLYVDRLPPICQTPVVAAFLNRYGFDDTEVAPEMLARPGSDAEVELLALLDVLAKSAPLHRVTCVEGFAYTGEGFYTTHIYGCGSPNVFRSAFVGLHATAFQSLHQDKAWLTVDTINFMGFKYIMRQNVKSEFTATVNSTTQKLALQVKTVTNFSSSGALYVVMVATDMLLMIVTFWSAIEIARLMIVPLIFAPASEVDTDLSMRGVVEDYKTVLTCSLYRSRPIVFLTVATQLLSWVIIIPNSTIWTWSTASKSAKIQAYLSSLRLWVLILVFFNELWDWVVFFHERWAYAISKRTYVASHEIILVGAVVSYVKRQEIFAVTGKKYAIERQRMADTTSFANRTAFGNSFNVQLDGFMNTPTDVLWVLYEPLVGIILWSVVGIVVVAILRSIMIFSMRHLRVQQLLTWWRGGEALVVRSARVQASEAVAIAADPLFVKRSLLDVSVAQPVDPPPTRRRSSIKQEQYARLPLEELLNVPIRARCLVRSTLQMEASAPQSLRGSRLLDANASTTEDRYIRAPFLLEHGLVLDHGRLRPRHGFFTFLQPRVELTGYVLPSTREALQSFQGRRLQRKNWREGLKRA